MDHVVTNQDKGHCNGESIDVTDSFNLVASRKLVDSYTVRQRKYSRRVIKDAKMTWSDDKSPETTGTVTLVIPKDCLDRKITSRFKRLIRLWWATALVFNKSVICTNLCVIKMLSLL